MGGFNSVTEGLPSGNSATASGVPLGNTAGEGNGSGGWADQAFAPSNTMTQQMPEPNGTAWKPNQDALEKASRNLLDNTVPGKASGFGGGLLTDDGESERKAGPIVSKLAREHSENPVRLSGSLLGAPETPKQEIKPPNPFAQRDELPKMPKIDWTVYDKHRIDGNRRIMHDDWARVISSTKDFGGIIPTFKFHIEQEGDAGRADVADMIGRVAQSNPDHARTFQRELSTALGGETIPARMARMVGDTVDNREPPGLLGPSKPSQYDFEQMRKDYWQSVETYKTELAQKQQVTLQQEPTTSEEPRQRQDMEAYPPTTEPPRSSSERNDPFGRIENLKPEHRATRETLEKIRDRGREHAADLLNHYLKGSGDPVALEKDWVRQHPPVKEGEEKSQKHFEDWLVGQGPGDRKHGKSGTISRRAMAP